jgi:hypothetical protein
MNMSNTLGYLRGELGSAPRAKRRSLGRRILAFTPLRKFLLALYNRIFRWYYA